jgi:cob(I)alamin adenosyltransferase
MSAPSITTRFGDGGTTQLFSGETVSKNSPQTKAYGDLDEVVSILGIARSLTQDVQREEQIVSLQRRLFVVGAELATSAAHRASLPQRIDAQMVAELDAERDALEASLPPPKGFILPGGTPAAAQLDLARSVARRCERRVVSLMETGWLDNELLLVWLNRLSDYLWLLARAEEGGATLMKEEHRG